MIDELKIEPIGFIETPFREQVGTPIQPSRASGARGRVHVDKRFHEGLRDLEGFERIWLIYWFHKAAEPNLLVTPYLDTTKRGVFATRAPTRPSPIGMSVVRLLAIRDGVLEVSDVDGLDGTPLLDIKPESRAGWLDQSESKRRLADARFDGATEQAGSAALNGEAESL